MIFRCISFVVFVLINCILHSQEVNSPLFLKSLNGSDDFKIFNAPSENFVPIVLQTHDDKIRFGVLNEYVFYPDGTYIDRDFRASNKAAAKQEVIIEGRNAFETLLEMKFMQVAYDDIDRQSITANKSFSEEIERNSVQAQQHLLKVANLVLKYQKLFDYFCNSDVENCLYDPSKYYGRAPNAKIWGGKGADEFEKKEAYTKFVSDNLDDLKSWSKQFTSENIESLMVLKTTLRDYDFDKGGYWLYPREAQNKLFFIDYFSLIPTKAIERDFITKDIKFLFKIPPEEAPLLKKKSPVLYLVFNIYVNIDGYDNRMKKLNKSYSFADSTFEIFQDEGLLFKLREMNLDNVITN